MSPSIVLLDAGGTLFTERETRATTYARVLAGHDLHVEEAQVGVTSGVAALDRAAMATASYLQFQPALRQGTPVGCTIHSLGDSSLFLTTATTYRAVVVATPASNW